MRLSFALIGLFVIAPVTAWADCNQNSDQKAMNACANEAYLKADSELTGLYKQASERLRNNAEALKLLAEAQKAWLGFRDGECAFATSSIVQSALYPMILAECREELTSKRVDVLKYYLKCEGDLSCPVPAK